MPWQLYHWYGGKSMLLKHIYSLMPPHNYYAELFGGSGVVLLNKEPVRLEIFNDIDKHVFELWKVIWEGKVAEVVEYMDKIFYDKNIFNWLRDHYEEIDDIPKRVAAWLFLIEATRNGVSTFKANFSSSYIQPKSQTWQNKKKVIYKFAERIKNVQIINNDWWQVYSQLMRRPQWQMEGFVYLDPPYQPATRVSKNVYRHETGDNWHVDFLIKVRNSPVRTMISAYESPLYDDILLPSGWQKYVVEVKTTASVNRELRKEVLWVNYLI